MNTSEASVRKKRILIFPFNLLSHYLRCLVLAKKYKDQGHEIMFLHSGEYLPYIRKHGFKTFIAEQFDHDYVMRCSSRFSFDWLNEEDIDRVYLSQKKAIELYKPDIVIGDMAPCLKMAAEATGMRYIALMNGYMSRFYAYPRKLSRTHPAYPYLKNLPKKWAEKITSFAERQAFRKVHRPFNRIRQKYRLQKVEDFLEEMEGDENLICDSPKLFPQVSLPANYRFIEPLIYETAEPESDLLSELPSSKPIICVCMGSSGDWKRLEFLNRPGFAKYTIIAAGDTEKVLTAPHIISRNFLNLDQVLSKSNLLICHGGNGTIYAGLKAGLFMLCVSSHFEQEWNIDALERMGYGESANDFSLDEWEKKILERALTELNHL